VTTAGSARFFRDNAFLVAAVTLPLLVVGLFVAATAIPRWFVAPPAYDLLLKTPGSYEHARDRITVGVEIREGRAEATVQRVTGVSPPPGPRLFLFEHETQTVREIPVAIPSLVEGSPPVTVPIAELSNRRVLVDAKAPDGYEFETGYGRGTGIVGELFGMGRRPHMSLVRSGRTVPITLPSNEYWYGVTAVGWVLEEGAR
jgi:hypothetical protein